MQHKNLEKQKQITSKPSLHQEIIKVRAAMNEIETMKTVHSINRFKRRFFDSIKLTEDTEKIINKE